LPSQPISNRSCSIDKPSSTAVPVIDGHNDTLMNLLIPERGRGRDFFTQTDIGHVDLPRMRQGSMAGGFFAMFVPTPDEEEIISFTDNGYEVQLASPIEQTYALSQTDKMFSLLESLAQRSPDEFRITVDTASIQHCLENDIAFAIPHIEGAEAIRPDLSNLDDLYQRGLRSLGPVWSRENAFAHGVPYAFPAPPDFGPGLTDAGKALVRACNKLGIMLDLSHINLAGFKDVASFSQAPLVATHSCVHTICPVSRNLTDWQIDAIGESNGLIGLAFDVSMLRADGDLNRDTPLSILIEHIDYIVQRIGVEHVALGSDFDGAVMPADLPDAAGLASFVAHMQEYGYDDESLKHITHRNWLRVLDDTWVLTSTD
jgi:membrane dipeptidase